MLAMITDAVFLKKTASRLRTLAHYTPSPSEILDSMNRRTLSRNQGRFTTCVVLRIDPKDSSTVANGSLPGRTGPEVSIPLPVVAQLTLYTDGVVEARVRPGEWFGFERAAGLSTEPAE
jgi:serine phosphatase RsbU (regulator of sigma subunit)